MELQILKILEHIGNTNKFEDSENFLMDRLLDSFAVMALVGELEEAFNIEIDGGDIIPDNFETLESIKKLVMKTKGDKND